MNYEIRTLTPRNKKFILMALTLLTGLLDINFAIAAMCSNAHCSASFPRTYAFCKLHNFGPEVNVPTYDPKTGAECDCSCSCVVGETLVEMDNGMISPIIDIRKGDYVFTPLSQPRYSPVHLRSQGPAGNDPLYKIVFSDGSSIMGSGDHTLITPDERIVSLNDLISGDTVLGKKGESIKVVEVKMEFYSGKIFNLVLNLGVKEAKGHVYPTNNVLSGDLLLQNRKGEISAELNARGKHLSLNDVYVSEKL